LAKTALSIGSNSRRNLIWFVYKNRIELLR
jgi:hypothetical protein